jgi:hypothetical protein
MSPKATEMLRFANGSGTFGLICSGFFRSGRRNPAKIRVDWDCNAAAICSPDFNGFQRGL